MVLDADAFNETGERILNLGKAFNKREGIVAGEYQIPDRAIGAPRLKEGPFKGNRVDLPALMDAFNRRMGWSLEKKVPHRKRWRRWVWGR